MTLLSDYLEIEHIYAQALIQKTRTIAVSAVNPQEGVTTVACALAKRSAQSGKKTLLVDMNYCRPSLDRHFQVARQHWRSSDDSMHQALNTHQHGLQVLPASLCVDEQLKRRETQDALFQRWQKTFDLVIVDTSPLNAINRRNIPAEQVCAAADTAILVLKSAVTKEADILQGLARLNSYQANVLGWVMNDVDCPSLGYEIQRELARLAKYTPRLARWLERWVNRSDLINQVV